MPAHRNSPQPQRPRGFFCLRRHGPQCRPPPLSRKSPFVSQNSDRAAVRVFVLLQVKIIVPLPGTIPQNGSHKTHTAAALLPALGRSDAGAAAGPACAGQPPRDGRDHRPDRSGRKLPRDRSRQHAVRRRSDEPEHGGYDRRSGQTPRADPPHHRLLQPFERRPHLRETDRLEHRSGPELRVGHGAGPRLPRGGASTAATARIRSRHPPTFRSTATSRPRSTSRYASRARISSTATNRN